MLLLFIGYFCTDVFHLESVYFFSLQYKSLKDSGDSSEPPEMASIMWIQSKDDSLFEDKSSFDESAVI